MLLKTLWKMEKILIANTSFFFHSDSKSLGVVKTLNGFTKG